MTSGGFTLPGEAGHEELTLRLAERWGADVIRDSDGTKLSREILDSGYGIYSTICLIREDREWALANSRLLQQNFLMSAPIIADQSRVRIAPLDGYSTDQFTINDWDGLEFWQVFDRTTGCELPRDRWTFADGVVQIDGAELGHSYTVNFLAMRLWEEISMYNHITNDWGDRPRLMAVEPRHPAVAEHLAEWLENWCVTHPETTVVRFTSLFYNFAWFWGSDPDLPQHYADWGSYDFTANPVSLRAFNEGREVPITSEDFVNAGRYTSTHNPPRAIYREWMAFTMDFVLELGKRLIEIVHRHGKQAYVFWDDSWIGVEPYSERFQEFGFDGLIKSVFSGYEARLNAGVDVPVHELRLHPYLFPVNLEGAPTFAPGGDPTSDARGYWTTMRRALLRARIDRIGLGGYLSLAEPFEDFQEYIATVADEHRAIRDLHLAGAPETAPVRVAVATSWGKLRSWTCSGHLHENPDLSLLQVIESLAGLPFDVEFLSLDEIAASGVPEGIDVLINAGPAGSAWSGGAAWANPELVAAVTRFVADGGGLLGIEQPAALDRAEAAGRLNRIQLAPVLGVDIDAGDRHVLVRRRYSIDPVSDPHTAIFAQVDPERVFEGIEAPSGVLLSRSGVTVLAERDGLPIATASEFGRGRAVYFANYRHGADAARALANAVFWSAGRAVEGHIAIDPRVDVAYFPASGKVLVANSSLETVATEILRNGNVVAEVTLEPAGLAILDA